MNHGVTVFDRAGRLKFWNRRFLALHKLRDDDVRRGMTLRELLETRKRRGSFDMPIGPVLAQWSAAVARREVFASTFAVGDDLIIAVVVQPLAGGGWVATHEDVTALERARERVAYLARTDVLTQLPNRSAVTEHIRERLASSSAGPAAHRAFPHRRRPLQARQRHLWPFGRRLVLARRGAPTARERPLA